MTQDNPRISVDELTEIFEASRRAMERKACAREQLAAMTDPATYTVGDLVTFVLVANVTATVRIVEVTDAKTAYAFSNGQIGARADERPLALWRPATANEAELYEAHALIHNHTRVALPGGSSDDTTGNSINRVGRS